MGTKDRIAEILAEAAGSDATDEAALILAAVGALVKALTLHRQQMGRATMPRPLRPTADQGPQFCSAQEAAQEFGLDPVRLRRYWKRLPFCRPALDGGRGFVVDRWLLLSMRRKGDPETP